MPAFPIHTLFGYLAGASLRESGHPLSEAIQEEQWLFLQASVTGADFPLMPYFACDQCGNPTRFPGPHCVNSVNPSDSFNGQTCPACHSGHYRPFVVDVPGWGTIDRHTLETRHYRRTHLVLGEYHGFGVHPDIPAGPEEQPFPSQVCERLVSVWRSVHRIGNRDGKRAKRLAFVAGWFAHVISDALFKGIYPHTCSIDFYGTHYGPVMHPPSEALAYFMAEELYGVDLSVWWREIPRQVDDGGALTLIADDGGDMTPVFQALRPVNAGYLVRMYGHPEYAVRPSPGEDEYAKADYRSHRYGPKNHTLEEIHAYARQNGFLDAFSTGRRIYERLMAEAAEQVAQGW
jgi:hypothetical protein